MIVGAILEAARHRCLVVIDGFAVSVAALIAQHDRFERAVALRVQSLLGGEGASRPADAGSASRRCSISSCAWAKRAAPPWPGR